MIKAIPMEDWLRGCIYHDGRHGYVTLPCDEVLKIADFIERLRADRKTEPMTTNLEWLRTLSEEELADWFYDEWLHHLQYRWSSSRGGLIIWLKERKTENSSEIPNNCKDLQDWKDRMWAEAIVTEPTVSKMEQVDKDINVRSKDEPQIEYCPRCGMRILVDKPKDEPQTEYKRWEVPPKVEPQTEITTCVSVPAFLIKDALVEDEPQTVETMSCQECKHFNENAVMYLDQCEFCFKECHYEPKDEPQTDCAWK